MGAQKKEKLGLPGVTLSWSSGLVRVPQLNKRWMGEGVQAEDTAQRYNKAWLMQGRVSRSEVT